MTITRILTQSRDDNATADTDSHIRRHQRFRYYIFYVDLFTT